MWAFLVATIMDNSDIEHFQRHGPSSIRQSALGQGFSTAPLLKTWLIFLVWESCPLHCKVFSSIPGIYPKLTVAFLSCANQRCLLAF